MMDIQYRAKTELRSMIRDGKINIVPAGSIGSGEAHNFLPLHR